MNNDLNIEPYKKPRHYGLLPTFTHKAFVAKTYCGDEITVTIQENDGKIENIGFEGSVCSLCLAGMSLLAEKLRGAALTDEEIHHAGENVFREFNVSQDSKRAACVLVGLDAAKKALKNSGAV